MKPFYQDKNMAGGHQADPEGGRTVGCSKSSTKKTPTQEETSHEKQNTYEKNSKHTIIEKL